MSTYARPGCHSRPLSVAEFDYGTLPVSLQRLLKEQVTSIQELLEKTSANVVQIGLRLQFVRDRLGRERFQPWLKREFQWSQPVASNYMRAARAFANVDCLARFYPSALFALARKKVPAAAREEALDRARHGQLITKKAATEIVARYVPAPHHRPLIAERLRRSLRSAIPALSPDELERIANELIDTARKMRTGLAWRGEPAEFRGSKNAQPSKGQTAHT